MGYVLYITRATSFLDCKEHPIPSPEWEAVVAADPTLSINTGGCYERRVGGVIERFHPIEWAASPDDNCFWFVDGAVECKNPSDAWIAKMVELSRLLGARVMGEEGEEYT